MNLDDNDDVPELIPVNYARDTHWDKIPEIIYMHKALFTDNVLFDCYVKLVFVEALKIGHIPTIDLIAEMVGRKWVLAETAKYANYDSFLHVISKYDIKVHNEINLADAVRWKNVKVIKYIFENFSFEGYQIRQALDIVLFRYEAYGEDIFVHLLEQINNNPHNSSSEKSHRASSKPKNYDVFPATFYENLSRANLQIIILFIKHAKKIDVDVFMHYVLINGQLETIKFLCNIAPYSYTIIDLLDKKLSSLVNKINHNVVYCLALLEPKILTTWTPTCFSFKSSSLISTKILYYNLYWFNDKRELLTAFRTNKYNITHLPNLQRHNKKKFENQLVQNKNLEQCLKSEILKKILKPHSLRMQMHFV
jgi:hypothetical protein